MKFRRNSKEEKLFKIVAVIGLLLLIILFILYLITSNEELLDLIIPLLFISPMYFFITYLIRNSFVEFQNDKITLVNGKFRSIEINISDIESILIPSPAAFKSKIKDYPIILKRKENRNIISYSQEIEKYIEENIEVNIVYYDNYSKAIKS